MKMLGFVGLVTALPEEEKVDEIPGMGTFDDFGVYSGYIHMEESYKSIHYMLV